MYKNANTNRAWLKIGDKYIISLHDIQAVEGNEAGIWILYQGQSTARFYSGISMENLFAEILKVSEEM